MNKLPPAATYLRRDHDDGDLYHIVHHQPRTALGVGYVAKHNACPLHIDMVRMVLGDQVADVANSLEPGESFRVAISARAMIDRDFIDLISDGQAKADLQLQTV